jgi:hypothetical protein
MTNIINHTSENFICWTFNSTDPGKVYNAWLKKCLQHDDELYDNMQPLIREHLNIEYKGLRLPKYDKQNPTVVEEYDYIYNLAYWFLFEQRSVRKSDKKYEIAVNYIIEYFDEYIRQYHSPASFGVIDDEIGYVYEYIAPTNICNVTDISSYILETHNLYDPAMAVVFDGKTYIGGNIKIY